MQFIQRMTSAEKRKEATIKLDFRPWLVLGGLLALAVLVTTIVLQTQNPYIHRRDKEAVVRDEDTEAQAAPVCRVHFASRKDTEVRLRHRCTVPSRLVTQCHRCSCSTAW